MIFGKYGAGNTDFSKLRLRKCDLSFFPSKDEGASGCGATALSLLTGESPKKFLTKNGLFNDAFMLKNLRKYGYKIYKCTQSNLTRRDHQAFCLDDRNLILHSHLVSKGTGTWLVSYNDYTIHNFEVKASCYCFDVSRYLLLNKNIKLLFPCQWYF